MSRLNENECSINKMVTALKILHLEDDPDDAEFIQHRISQEIPGCIFETVWNREDYIRCIETHMPNVILSDNQLPQFSAREALRIHKEKALPIPFILVTGTVSEEFASSIIREGADDYLLKDRLNRLPDAIHAALHKRKIAQEIRDYKYALDQSSIVIITDANGAITYVNENFCKRSRYGTSELIGENIRILNSGYHPMEYFQELWNCIASGRIWKGEFRNKSKTGEFYWVDATIVPFMNMAGEPVQYLSIRNDITNKKSLEEDIINQKIQEQKIVARAILHAQESERNHLGQELHDNVNQILVSAKLLLEYVSLEGGESNDLVIKSMNLVDTAITEIRLLSSRQVTPTKNIDLKELLTSLMESVRANSNIQTEINYQVYNPQASDELKLNIYRIVQELVNNSIKHAAANRIQLDVLITNSLITISMEDNGKGFDTNLKRPGIGISNLRNRVEAFNGTMEIVSSLGNGCRVDVSIPY
ncbi:MAG TPA: PAS domain S-box protein [Flavitalea sp.]|nr:PAS domain S-box protein [Flavitalea sp.]